MKSDTADTPAPTWLTMGMLVADAMEPSAVMPLVIFEPRLALGSRRLLTKVAVSTAAMATLAPGTKRAADLAAVRRPERAAASPMPSAARWARRAGAELETVWAARARPAGARGP